MFLQITAGIVVVLSALTSCLNVFLPAALESRRQRLAQRNQCMIEFSKAYSSFRIKETPEEHKVSTSNLDAIVQSAYALLPFCSVKGQEAVLNFVTALIANYFAGDKSTNEEIYQLFATCCNVVMHPIASRFRVMHVDPIKYP